MNDYGHVKMSRKAFLPIAQGGDVWWNERREFSRWEAWVYLIQSAAWRAHKTAIGGQLIQLRRGETPPLSMRFLQKAWGWSSTNKVHAFIKLLIEDERITIGRLGKNGHENVNGSGTTYLIVNYALYQDTQNGTRNGKRTAAERQENETEAGKAIKDIPDLPAWPQRAGALWIERYGGTAPYGRIGKAFKLLVETHGEESVLAAWGRYLSEADEEFANPQAFAAKFGRWTGNGSSRHDEPKPIIRNAI